MEAAYYRRRQKPNSLAAAPCVVAQSWVSRQELECIWSCYAAPRWQDGFGGSTGGSSLVWSCLHFYRIYFQLHSQTQSNTRSAIIEININNSVRVNLLQPTYQHFIHYRTIFINLVLLVFIFKYWCHFLKFFGRFLPGRLLVHNDAIVIDYLITCSNFEYND